MLEFGQVSVHFSSVLAQDDTLLTTKGIKFLIKTIFSLIKSNPNTKLIFTTVKKL